MSRSRYRPKYRPEKPTGAPCRDLRRAEVEERGYVRCDFVPLHGRARRIRPEPVDPWSFKSQAQVTVTFRRVNGAWGLYVEPGP